MLNSSQAHRASPNPFLDGLLVWSISEGWIGAAKGENGPGGRKDAVASLFLRAIANALRLSPAPADADSSRAPFGQRSDQSCASVPALAYFSGRTAID